MGEFADRSNSSLPSGMTPAALEQLFDWIESNGWVVDGAEQGIEGLVGSLQPFDQRGEFGTWVEFHVEAAAEAQETARWWLGVDQPGLADRLVVFAQTGADGSQAALWLDDEGRQRIVHLGSGSGSTLAGVIADDLALGLAVAELAAVPQPRRRTQRIVGLADAAGVEHRQPAGADAFHHSGGPLDLDQLLTQLGVGQLVRILSGQTGQRRQHRRHVRHDPVPLVRSSGCDYHSREGV
jgi:hypothetical protein